MSKCVLLSVKPQYVAKILNGEKTIEIRKHAIPVGTKVYVYVCKSKSKKLYHIPIMPDKGVYKYMCLWDSDYEPKLNGKVVASFVVGKTTDLMKWFRQFKDNEFYDILKNACVDTNYLQKYAGNDTKKLFGLHISQLKIFDRPKELKEFSSIKKDWCNLCHTYHNRAIIKAPQSFVYVEELK